MDKNRKNIQLNSTKLLKEKPLTNLNQPKNKSHKHILSKTRNTLEDTKDTLTGNKNVKTKNSKEGFSSST